jgi:Mlc titration factor MtfA (ptsG expression regulator)
VSDHDSLALAGALTLAAVTVAAAWYGVRKRRRAAQIRERFPEEWRALLQRALPLYRRMPADLRLRLEPLVREFLLDVDFIGCQGLIVTDEMRLVIAVQACLLTVGSHAGKFRSLYSVLLYPDEFVVEESDEDEAGVVTHGTRVLSGQTLETSRIVLSWRDVQESGTTEEVDADLLAHTADLASTFEPDPGAYNVVLHEFAHYLDHSVEGALTRRSPGRRALERWHSVLSREYEALCDAVDAGQPTLIDPYGAEHLEEFFAVATETFFEQPRDLQRRHSQLYQELRAFYGLDPASWPLAEPG